MRHVMLNRRWAIIQPARRPGGIPWNEGNVYKNAGVSDGVTERVRLAEAVRDKK